MDAEKKMQYAADINELVMLCDKEDLLYFVLRFLQN